MGWKTLLAILSQNSFQSADSQSISKRISAFMKKGLGGMRIAYLEIALDDWAMLKMHFTVPLHISYPK